MNEKDRQIYETVLKMRCLNEKDRQKVIGLIEKLESQPLTKPDRPFVD